MTKNIDFIRYDAYLNGCIVAYNIEQAMDIVSFGVYCDESYDLIHDDDVFFNIRKSLFAYYSSCENADDVPKHRSYKETLSSQMLLSGFSDFIVNLCFFRLNKNIPVDNINLIHKILSDNCNYSPSYIWIKGNMYFD